MLVFHLSIYVAVLLGGASSVELSDVQIEIDDRLEEIESSHDVRVDRLVGTIPRLANVCLCSEVKHDRVRVFRQVLLAALLEEADGTARSVGCRTRRSCVERISRGHRLQSLAS